MLHHVMHDTASHTASEERAASSEQAASADARTHCGCRKGELVTASTSVRQSQLQGLVLSASATSGNTLEIISCTRLSAVSVPLDYQVDKHTHKHTHTHTRVSERVNVMNASMKPLSVITHAPLAVERDRAHGGGAGWWQSSMWRECCRRTRRSATRAWARRRGWACHRRPARDSTRDRRSSCRRTRAGSARFAPRRAAARPSRSATARA